MNISIKKLKEHYDYCSKYLNYLESEHLLESEEDVSPFWQALFKEYGRKNYPTFNEILTMRRGFTYGLADAESNINNEKEYQHTQAAYLDVSKTVPESYFRECEESAIGSPLCFDIKGKIISRGFIANALTSYRIIKWCQNRGLKKRPLKILEIGAGYGSVAYQLIKQLEVTEYAICDLPENLFLSSYYLQANFPDKKTVFITKNNYSEKQTGYFKFFTPYFLEKVTDKFDLVINSYSLQEMNLESVKRYFDYAKKHLTNTGIFYSLNSHGKSGVVNPSDYPIEQFTVLNLESIRQAPWEQVFSTTPYELVLINKSVNTTLNNKKGSDFIILFDALAKAFQLGLCHELNNLSIKFINSELSKKETEWLKILNDFFNSQDYREKNNLLNLMLKIKILLGITLYISGSLEFANGNFAKSKSILEKALKKISNSQAKLRILMMLSNICYISFKTKEGNHYLQQAINISPYLTKDMLRLVKNYHNLEAQISRTINLSVPPVLSLRYFRIINHNISLLFSKNLSPIRKY